MLVRGRRGDMFLLLVAASSFVTGTTFISTGEEGILKAVPAITSELLHDPGPLLHLASRAQVGAFFTGPCVYGFSPSSPWWTLDLGDEMKVTGVKVTAAGTCCHPWLENFTIQVANRKSADGEYFGLQTCATRNGTVDSGVTILLPCKTPVTGRYVILSSLCVDMFGILLSCQLEATTEAMFTRSMVFHGSQAQWADEDSKLDCARKCSRDPVCVRFDNASPTGCALYDTAVSTTPTSYVMYNVQG